MPNFLLRCIRPAAAVLCLGTAAVAVAAPEYTRVLPGAAVSFTATQMGTPMPGRFKQVEAVVRFAPGDLAASHVTVTVETASVSAGDAQTDDLLLGPDWLDAKAFAQARFVSSSFTPAGPGRYWVDGTFSVKGRARPLRALLTTHAQGQALALDAQFALDRSACGLGVGPWADTSVVAARIPVQVHVLVAPGP